MARKRSRRPPAATLARRWSVVAGVVIVAYLYYHPLRTYFSTRNELSSQRAQVAQLGNGLQFSSASTQRSLKTLISTQRQQLERRLAATTSLGALARQARELGYVRPGEHLYIVKGIEAWRAHEASLARSGK